MEAEVKHHWINIFFLIGTLALAVVLVPWYLWVHGLAWPLAIYFFVACVATSCSITAGYHRLFAHRAYETRRWIEFLFMFWGAGAFQGSILQWASDHRRHHRFVDTDKDPYNINKGFWWAHIGWLFFEDAPEVRGQFAPDLERDKWISSQHRYYVPLSVFVGFVIPMLVGWSFGDALGGLIIGGLARLVFTQHCTFFINSLCHTFGRRPYNDKISARDSFIMALFTYGEGYHNYHHQFQADYRNGIRWYHWDPTKWTIRLMAWLGLASRLKRVQPTEILKARLKNDEQKLVHHGVAAEQWIHLKERVEQAQLKMRRLHEDYKRLKASMQESSRAQLQELRLELKLARLEFKFAFAQWRVIMRRIVAMN